MSKRPRKLNLPARIRHWLGWNRSSYYLMSAFVLTLILLGYVWWPLAEEYLSYIPWDGAWWRYIDWLLINIFLFMSLTIMAKADLRQDFRIILVGLAGGLVIESWGTQTEIWTYYTNERPPLWIIPAWPIASLSIDRLVCFLDRGLKALGTERRSSPPTAVWRVAYWIVFLLYGGILLEYVAPTMDKPLTWLAVLTVVFLTLTPTDHRLALITFVAGSGLGYFLELWGTTREAWTYYTLARPPVFAVLSHGLAAVAFWRAVRVLDGFLRRLRIARGWFSPSEPAGIHLENLSGED